MPHPCKYRGFFTPRSMQDGPLLIKVPFGERVAAR
jgi:hypothetical protein